MNPGKFVCAFLFIAFCASSSFAEDPAPKIDIEYRYTAPEGVARPAAGYEGVKLGYSNYNVRFTVPQPMEAFDGYVMYGFRYSHTDIADSGWSGTRPDFIGPLQFFAGDISFVKPLAEGARVSALINLGYYGAASN